MNGIVGGYLFLESKYGDTGYQGYFYSQRLFSKSTGSWCLAFSYRMMQIGDVQSQLIVRQISIPTGAARTIFSTDKSTDGKWVDVLLDMESFETNADFFLEVEGDVAYDTPKPSRIGTYRGTHEKSEYITAFSATFRRPKGRSLNFCWERGTCFFLPPPYPPLLFVHELDC